MPGMHMKNFIKEAVFLFAVCIMVAELSCKVSATGPYMYPEIPEPAPEKTLPAREIMRLQGITSIHFSVYDSVIVNNKKMPAQENLNIISIQAV